jgi:cytochrome c oxidase subunit 2
MKITHLIRQLALRAGMTATAAATAMASTLAQAAETQSLQGGPQTWGINFQEPVTEIAHQQMWLHGVMLWICTGIFVVVFGVMFYSIFKHRRSKGHQAANFHESVAVEVAWTVVPFIIVCAMGAMATRTVVAMKDTTNPDLTIKATGYQWKWGYDYITGEGAGIAFISTLDTAQRDLSNSGNPSGNEYLLKVDHPLVVPVDRKVRIITTANDVIHAWWVPAFGTKQDAIPGFVRDTWFKAEKTGDFYGQCAELCGKEHAFMPIHVVVLSGPDYSKWVAEQQKEMKAKADDPNKVWTQPDLIARGEKVYTANCAVCHKPDGKGAGPVKPLDGSSVVLDADKNAQVSTVLQGRVDKGMPSWKSVLSDTEIAAVVTYTKNNWSNHTGQVVQPSEVAATRAKL